MATEIICGSRSSSESGKKKEAKISGSSSSPPKNKEKGKEEEVEKSVFIGVNAYDEEGVNEFGRSPEVTDCYLIKLSTTIMNEIGRVEEPLSVEPIGRKLPLPWRSCYVALGSTIYCTINNACDAVRVLAMDTSNINIDCKEVALLNLGSEASLIDAVTADDGKIYVFCDSKRYNSSIDDFFLCNVFDPTNNTWKPIDPPTPSEALSFICPDDTFSVYDDTARRILMGSLGGRHGDHGFLISYNLEDASWKILDQALLNTSVFEEYCYIEPHLKSRSRPAFFDNTLYWIGVCNGFLDYSGIYAYDLDLQTPIYGHIFGIHSSFWGSHSNYFQLHHFRGDLFFLIWLHDQVVRCERVRISISKREGHQTSVEAHVLSTQAYQLLDTSLYYQIGAVLL